MMQHLASTPTKLRTVKVAKDILIEEQSIVLEETGRVKFIDILAEYDDGTYENIASEAVWSSSDTEIVSVNSGQIIAGNRGTAIITVTYQELEEKISVTVQETIDVATKINEILAEENEIMQLSMSSSERSSAASRAKEMVEFEWTPTQDLVGWRGNYLFKAGEKVTGMPYSQTEYQKDKAGFVASLSYSDFCSSYSRFGITMPKYGNDCSAFVSFAWGLSRKTTQGFLQGIYSHTYSTVGGLYYNILEEEVNDSKYYSIIN